MLASLATLILSFLVDIPVSTLVRADGPPLLPGSPDLFPGTYHCVVVAWLLVSIPR